MSEQVTAHVVPACDSGADACSIEAASQTGICDGQASEQQPLNVSISRLSGDRVAEFSLPRTTRVLELCNLLEQGGHALDGERGVNEYGASIALMQGDQTIPTTVALQDLLPHVTAESLELLMVQQRGLKIEKCVRDGSSHDMLFKVILVGDSGCGKSSLLRNYDTGDFSEAFIPTIGIDFRMICLMADDSLCIKLQIWDTTGQERFRQLSSSYYRGCHVAFIVFDVTDRNSFNSIERWLLDLEQYAREDIQLCIIGSKCDQTDKRVVGHSEAETFAKARGLKFYGTSALSGEGVEAAIHSEVATLIRRMRGLP